MNNVSRGVRIALLTVLLTPLGGALATAQQADIAQESRDFPVERFRLALDANGVLDAESGEVPDHLSYGVALFLGFADDPLLVERREGNQTEIEGALVGSRLGAEIVLSVALYRWVQLGIGMPVVLFQDRQSSIDGVAPLSELGGAGVGAIRFVPKVRLLTQALHGLHMAIMPTFVTPSLSGDAYYGQRTWTFEPELAASRDFGLINVIGNLGYRVRQEEGLPGLEVDDEIFARVGAGVRLDEIGGPPIGVDVTLAGATNAERPLARGNRDYGELLGGVRYAISKPLLAYAGVGVGLNRGFGTPDWRAFAGLRWSALTVDTDGDGIVDRFDACPEVPEDIDGYRDTDGCPDRDNDGDGLEDGDDGAPMRPEDFDGFEDGDGVPDPDNDGDEVMDWDDGCPLTPGPVPNRGCPDADADGDGVDDRQDACPEVAEDIDQFADDDGCPDPDDDLDGVADGEDNCPREAGPAENLGCPDTDVDGDSVVDRLDNCPTQAGDPRNQGCVAPQLVKINTSLDQPRLEILEKVHFAIGRAVIQPRSFPLLNDVAAVLKAHPEIKKLQVEGHTDSTGSMALNLRLSDRRAEAVRRYLIRKGVESGRLQAAGFGPNRPVASNATVTGRAANRRVEFNILRRP